MKKVAGATGARSTSRTAKRAKRRIQKRALEREKHQKPKNTVTADADILEDASVSQSRWYWVRPGEKLVQFLYYWLGAAAVLVPLRYFFENNFIFTLLSSCWWVVGAIFLVVITVDALLQHVGTYFWVDRQVPGSLSIGVPLTVSLVISHRGQRAKQLTQLKVFDHIPQNMRSEGLPRYLSLDEQAACQFEYQITPTERGAQLFPGCEIMASSTWGFWERRFWVPTQDAVRVFPNFAAIVQASTLGFEAQMQQLGIHMVQRRGEGMDFKQLRAFQVGDTLRQIDWKATARRNKPIAREYQDERDQEIIFLLDCGQSMRAQEGGVAHFDAALNAVLLAAYTALRQGDRVGLMTFAGQDLWQPPVTGQARINVFLNQVYNLTSTTAANDYLAAARQLIQRQRKRAVVILVTNLRLGLIDNLLAATRLLMTRHSLCMVSLKENALAHAASAIPSDLSEAVTLCSAHQLIDRRERLLSQLRKNGLIAVDSFPEHLHYEVIRQYHCLKRSGAG